MGPGEENVAGLCPVTFTLSIQLILCRTDPTSLPCVLPDNITRHTNNVRKDRIIANSDGAFIIKTNKKSGDTGRLIWDKQKTAIAFEACSLQRSNY